MFLTENHTERSILHVRETFYLFFWVRAFLLMIKHSKVMFLFYITWNVHTKSRIDSDLEITKELGEVFIFNLFCLY